jgi:hypothetical protein
MKQLYATAIRHLFARHSVPAFADAAAELIIKSAFIRPNPATEPLTDEQVMKFLDDFETALKGAVTRHLLDERVAKL